MKATNARTTRVVNKRDAWGDQKWIVGLLIMDHVENNMQGKACSCHNETCEIQSVHPTNACKEGNSRRTVKTQIKYIII